MALFSINGGYDYDFVDTPSEYVIYQVETLTLACAVDTFTANLA